MKVELGKEPITAEALETVLRRAKNAAAGVHAHLVAAVSEFQKTYSGAELQMHKRDLRTVENALDIALRHADAIQSQVEAEMERVTKEDETVWGVSPEEFGKQMNP